MIGGAEQFANTIFDDKNFDNLSKDYQTIFGEDDTVKKRILRSSCSILHEIVEFVPDFDYTDKNKLSKWIKAVYQKISELKNFDEEEKSESFIEIITADNSVIKESLRQTVGLSPDDDLNVYFANMFKKELQTEELQTKGSIPQTIKEYLKNTDTVSDFASNFDEEFYKELNDAENLTVIAPSNDGFSKLEDYINANNFQRSNENFKSIINYHISLTERINNENDDDHTMKNGKRLGVSDDTFKDSNLDKVVVIAKKTQLKNGFVYIINRVLIPDGLVQNAD